jgi:SAM-dependent methyltransferase
VLDVGCGSVALMGLLAGVVGPANVVGVDPDAETVTMAAARLPGVRFDIAPGEALPYGDGEFDGVLAQLVVSLIDDARAGRRRDAVPHGGANSLLPPARAATAHGAHESLPHDGA